MLTANSIYGVKNAWHRIYRLVRIANKQWNEQNYRTAHYYMKQANFIAENIRRGGVITNTTFWSIRNFIETFEKI